MALDDRPDHGDARIVDVDRQEDGSIILTTRGTEPTASDGGGRWIERVEVGACLGGIGRIHECSRDAAHGESLGEAS